MACQPFQKPCFSPHGQPAGCNNSCRYNLLVAFCCKLSTGLAQSRANTRAVFDGAVIAGERVRDLTVVHAELACWCSTLVLRAA